MLIESEQEYFSKEIVLLRTKARELGYGDGHNGNIRNVGWFDQSYNDPVVNEEVRMECLEASTEEEMKIVETFRKVVQKAVRLTSLLSEEEKTTVKRYNEVARFFGSSLMLNGAGKGWWPGHTEGELEELRLRYEQIMSKHGEETYE